MATTTQEKPGLTWEEVSNDPHLRDLPYKIETNEWGQIVTSPPPPLKHDARQFRIARLLEENLSKGRATVKAPVRTTKGTKVPDTAWVSAERWEKIKDGHDAPPAPEICVEVLSPSNIEGEMKEKRRLYLEAGAEEVWLCNAQGQMQFFNADGQLERSKRVPDFPAQVAL